MSTYTWNKDRELIKSSSTPLHRGDTNVGKLEFIIPTTIDDVDITILPLKIRYTLPNGDTYVKTIEETDEEFNREGFVKYVLPLTPTMTSVSGRVEFDLRFDNITEDNASDDKPLDKPSGDDKDPDLADKDDLDNLWGNGATTFDLDVPDPDITPKPDDNPDEGKDDEKELEFRIYSNTAYYTVTPNSNFY